MGGTESEILKIGLKNGEGYRIINVQPNSPLQNQVDIFFDFIIDAIPIKQPQRATQDQLDKFTDGSQNQISRQVKNLKAIFIQNENSPIKLKIVSTKYLNTKIVQVIPNRNWSNSGDLMGITTRVQRYAQTVQTYFPIYDVRPHSPVEKSGIKSEQYLIGCKEFKYVSINQFQQNLYEHFFDKSIEDKHVNLAIYNLEQDQLRIVPVLLARGWGEQGLLGCKFLEGSNGLPKNLKQVRKSVLFLKKNAEDKQKLKKTLNQCTGASVQLIQSLKKNKKKHSKGNFQTIPLIQPNQKAINIPQKVSNQKQISPEQYATLDKFKQLQNKVVFLEQNFIQLRQEIIQMSQNEEK